MITQSTFKIIQILLSEQVLYWWRRTKQETICRLVLVSSIVVPMQCYIHVCLMTLRLLIFIISAKLRGSVRDGGDVIGVGPRLRPWTIHLRSWPTARYAAAKIHRWGCLFFPSAPLSTCPSVLWASRGLCCADLFVCSQKCPVCGSKLCAFYL